MGKNSKTKYLSLLKIFFSSLFFSSSCTVSYASLNPHNKPISQNDTEKLGDGEQRKVNRLGRRRRLKSILNILNSK